MPTQPHPPPSDLKVPAEPSVDNMQPSQISLDVSQITENARQQVIEEKQSVNELRSLITRFREMKVVFMQVGGHTNEGSLIYIALSKVKRETVSHLRK